MYRDAWRKGLKTTYYLRTLGASNIEKATVTMKQVEQNQSGAVTGSMDTSAKQYTDEEKEACSIKAMIIGEDCEACQ